MKRSQSFVSQNCYQLDLPLEELAVLLGDDDGLLTKLGFGCILCLQCSMPVENLQNCEVYLDADCCLYVVSPCQFCSEKPAYAFIDTTDLPDWQYILRHLLRQQMGMNSWGDE